MISKKMAKALNEQIVQELHSSNAYIALAGYLDGLGLKVMSSKFFQQSDEERVHAMKFVRFLLDVGAPVSVGVIPPTKNDFKSVDEAVSAALEQEKHITDLINKLMALAHSENDYATASFLKWFIDEQVEEISTVTELLQLVRLAGPDRILLVEERIMRMGLGGGAKGED